MWFYIKYTGANRTIMSPLCIFKPFLQQRCSLSYIGWLTFYPHVEPYYFTKMGGYGFIKLIQSRHCYLLACIKAGNESVIMCMC